MFRTACAITSAEVGLMRRTLTEDEQPHGREGMPLTDVHNLSQGQHRIEQALISLTAEQRKLGRVLSEVREDLGRLTVAGTPVAPFGAHFHFQAQQEDSDECGLKLPTESEELACYPTLLSPRDPVSLIPVQEEAEDAGDGEEDTLVLAEKCEAKWPATLRIRRGIDYSMAVNDCASMGSMSLLAGRTSNFSVTAQSCTTADSDHDTSSFARRCCLSDPQSGKHMIFDIGSLLILGFDLLLIPYVLAWDLPFEGFLLWTAWTTCVFWTLDIAINFLTGYYTHGRLELRARKIARHYLKTWFVPDAVVVACDWTSMVMLSVASSRISPFGLKILRFAKVGRLLRIVALVRMMRFSQAVEEYIETQLSETYQVALKISLLFFGTLCLNHWITCAWIAVGRLAPSDTGMRWVDTEWAMGETLVYYMESGRLFQYITAFHWSVAQFTLGAIEISCYNSWERAFNILCLIVGMLFGSALISSLSATMVDFQMMRKDKNLRMRRLRQFLREHCVDRKLSVRVQQQVTERLGKKERLAEQDVTALKLLSHTLRVELRFNIFQRYISTHPLFQLWLTVDESFVHRLCKDALDFSFLRPKDDLFVSNSVSERAFYLVSGGLTYYPDPVFFDNTQELTQVTCVGQNSWLCEMALWVDWIHVGRAEAVTHCELVTMHATRVVEACKRHRRIKDITSQYCREYHQSLIVSSPPRSHFPTDLVVPSTEWEKIVMAMDRDVQVVVGMHAIETMSSQIEKGHCPACDVEPLEDEVTQGKCCLLVSASGEIERLVSVVALQITRGERLLVQLGRYEDGRLIASCQLPCTKFEQGESTHEATQRILAEKLRPLVGNVEVTKQEFQEVEWKVSKRYNLRTKYLRTVCTCELQSDTASGAAVVGEASQSSRSNQRLFRVMATPSSPAVQNRWSVTSSECVWRRSRSTSTASSIPTANAALPPGITLKEVCMLCDEDKNTKVFYIWLDRDEYEQVRMSSNEDKLFEWLNALKDAPPLGDENGDDSQEVRELQTMESKRVRRAFSLRSDSADSGPLCILDEPHGRLDEEKEARPRRTRMLRQL